MTKKMKNVTVTKIKDNSTQLPTIKCICGVELFMVPDAKLMGEAIEAHVEVHKGKIKDPEKAEIEAERIRDYLTAQALEKASNI